MILCSELIHVDVYCVSPFCVAKKSQDKWSISSHVIVRHVQGYVNVVYYLFIALVTCLPQTLHCRSAAVLGLQLLAMRNIFETAETTKSAQWCVSNIQELRGASAGVNTCFYLPNWAVQLYENSMHKVTRWLSFSLIFGNIAWAQVRLRVLQWILRRAAIRVQTARWREVTRGEESCAGGGQGFVSRFMLGW